jgi:ubiquinone biosynthesis protein Coq4
MRNVVQRVKAISSFVNLVRDPNRLGQVFQLSDSVVNPEIMRTMAEHVAKSEVGRKALAERVRLRLDLAELRALPPGTLGREFAEHMIKNGLDPAAIPSLPSESELDFVRAHLYDTHDVWHVVTGFGTDVAGELGLQAFYQAQLPGQLPMAILSAVMLNTLLYRFDDRDARMTEIARGWQLGKRAEPLFGIRWDKLWAQPLVEIRRDLGLAAN